MKKLLFLVLCFASWAFSEDCIACPDDQRDAPCCISGCLAPPQTQCQVDGCHAFCSGTQATCPENHEVRFEWVGKSAQLKLFENECTKNPESDPKRFIKFKLESLHEIEPNGNPTHNEVNEFASQDLTLKEATTDSDFIFVLISGSLRVNQATIPFHLQVQFFTKPVALSFGTTNQKPVTVDAESLKFSMQVENWPFIAHENKLRFSASIQTPGSHSYDLMQTENITFISFHDDSHSTNFAVPMFCELDGSLKRISVQVDQRQNSAQFDINFEFPSFQNKLFWDPISSLSNSTANVSLTGWGAVLIALSLGFLFCACTAAGGWYFG